MVAVSFWKGDKECKKFCVIGLRFGMGGDIIRSKLTHIRVSWSKCV